MQMQLEKEQLDQIGSYVRTHINEWLDETSSRYSQTRLGERIIRVEEELKSQREILTRGFDQIDKRLELMQSQTEKRFEQVDKRLELMQSQTEKRFEFMERQFDKRFEQVDKRFNQLMWMIGIGFSLTAASISIMATHIR